VRTQADRNLQQDGRLSVFESIFLPSKTAGMPTHNLSSVLNCVTASVEPSARCGFSEISRLLSQSLISQSGELSMNAIRLIAIASALGAASLLTACETTNSPGTFAGAEAGRAQSVQRGTVYSVRDVTIQNEPNRVGTVAGGALGGIAGSTLGGGNRANSAGAIAGAVAGGAVANAATRSTQAGVEITVLLESNQLMSVVQAGSSNEFRQGDAVRVTSNGMTTRVTR
jgi:outer membrane lipoprotein SlyB